MLHCRHRALYAAFDRFPAPKGAAVHIARFARGLFDTAGGGLLFVMGGAGYPSHQVEDDVEIVRFSREVPNLLERTIAFGHRLARLLDDTASTLEICHFRDPWSGVPILRRPGRAYRTVYEVNALPSIELPTAYPDAAASALDKIRALERFCLDQADRIVTPSATTRDLLVRLGTAPSKIRVIQNGAEVLPTPARPPDAPQRYLLYFGALQRWQGMETLLRACARLTDLPDLGLVVCASAQSRESARLMRLAERLGVQDRCVWRFALSDTELGPWRAHATIAVAPLRECARNVVQGCSPLKILEAMAAGVPVVASDLAPVRELVTDGVEGRLVPADRPGDLARAVRVLLDHPGAASAMGRAGRARVLRELTWERSLASLREVHGELLADRDVRPFDGGLRRAAADTRSTGPVVTDGGGGS
jgi:glycosyltransferase involved in cell wall biosynthesis